MQRLRSRRRVRRDRRTKPRARHLPRQNNQEIRRAHRHRARDFREPGAHGGSRQDLGRGQIYRARRERKPESRQGGGRQERREADDVLRKRNNRGHKAQISGHERRKADRGRGYRRRERKLYRRNHERVLGGVLQKRRLRERAESGAKAARRVLAKGHGRNV